MNWHLDHLLKLSNITVVKMQEIEDFICLNIENVKEGIICPHCGNYTEDVNQRREVLVRDLPICGRSLYLKVPRRQFVCGQCGKYTTEELKGIICKRHHTKRYEEYIYERVVASTVKQVCREERLNADEIQTIFNEVNKSKKEEKWQQVKRVGLDELSTGKGQKKYKAVVSDLDRKCLIEVVENRSQEKVIKSLSEQEKELRERVEEVCVDMWGGFTKVIRKVFPNARIVYDRFHIMQMVNKRLNEIRFKIGIRKRGISRLLLGNQENLSCEEKEKLSNLIKASPSLQIAYEIKENLREIYEKTRTVSGGMRKLRKWLRTAEVFYGDICNTIRQHLEGICNYFVNRTTNAVMEGLNNRSRVILRQTYGLKNFEHLRSRLLAANH